MKGILLGMQTYLSQATWDKLQKDLEMLYDYHQEWMISFKQPKFHNISAKEEEHRVKRVEATFVKCRM